MSDIELSLDELIKKKKINLSKVRGGRVGKREFRGNSGGGNGGGRPQFKKESAPYSKGDADSKWKHDLFEGESSQRSDRRPNRRTSEGGQASAKIIISNLDFGVSDSDVKELFGEFGPIRSSAVHYDKSGRSLGTAFVHFEKSTDAVKALNQYNGVPLDGREMKIEFATGSSGSQSSGFASRLGDRPRRERSDFSGRGSRSDFGSRGRSEFGRGRGGRGRGGAGGRGRVRSDVTAEDLDRELDAYKNKMETE